MISLQAFWIILGIVGTACAGVVWLFANFITRKEAERLEKALDSLVRTIKEVIGVRLDHLENRVEKVESRKKRSSLRVVRG